MSMDAEKLSTKLLGELKGKVSAKKFDEVEFYDAHGEWETSIEGATLYLLDLGLNIPEEVLSFESSFIPSEVAEVKQAISAQAAVAGRKLLP